MPISSGSPRHWSSSETRDMSKKQLLFLALVAAIPATGLLVMMLLNLMLLVIMLLNLMCQVNVLLDIMLLVMVLQDIMLLVVILLDIMLLVRCCYISWCWS